MLAMTKQYVVTNMAGQRITVIAGSIGFTPSGDLLFEDELGKFQQSFANGSWKHVEMTDEPN